MSEADDRLDEWEALQPPIVWCAPEGLLTDADGSGTCGITLTVRTRHVGRLSGECSRRRNATGLRV